MRPIDFLSFSWMFISLLSSCAYSIWWDFDRSTYPSYEQNSVSKPIFALCTTPTCPHCRGLPEKFKSYANQIGNKTNVVFTHFDCSKNHLCSKAQIRGVPQFVLIRGKSSKHWKLTGERSPDGWSSFLSQELKANLVQLSKPSDTLYYSQSVLMGTSLFHLWLPSGDEISFKAFKKAANQNSHLCSAFTYIETNNEVPSLTVFASSTCNFTFTGKDLDYSNIIKSHYRSYYSTYDSSDFDDVASNQNLFLAVSEGAINEHQKIAINRMSEKYCGKIAFGWADSTKSEALIKQFGMTKEDSPFYIGFNSESKCISASKGRILAADREGFVKNIIAGKNCSNKIVSKEQIEAPPSQTRSILIVCVVGVIMSIAYLAWEIFKPQEAKLE